MLTGKEIIPKNSLILVEEIENRDRGYMLLPESHKEQIQMAIVHAIGPLAEDVVVGDTVVYAVNKGHKIDKFKLILSEDVLAAIR